MLLKCMDLNKKETVFTAERLKVNGRDSVIISAVNDVLAVEILREAGQYYGVNLFIGVDVYWTVPVEYTADDKFQLRKLVLDDGHVEWSRPLVFTDAPEIREAAVRCNSELMAAVSRV